MPGKEKKPSRKGKRDAIELRKIIAWRIGDERRKNFPGFGGAKKCAEALGVSQSQLSHWEHDTRTPDNECLKKIAGVFGVTAKHLKTPPENWEGLFEELSRTNQSDPAAGGNDGKPKNIPMRNTPNQETRGADEIAVNASDAAVSIKAIIVKILEADEMHGRGEIPTQLFEFAMESVNEHLTKLFSKRNFLHGK